MKRGRLQIKDIPTEPILRLLWERPGVWYTWFSEEGPAQSVRKAFPVDCPDKLVIAKMRSLIKRGLVRGCGCGCRGDYHVGPSWLQ